jgi:hypothetical protein
MITQKRGLLSRVRIVLTALVMLTGIGTTLMAMKPVTDYTYHVAETANGTNWEVLDDVTNYSEKPYRCDPSSSVCTVEYNQPVPDQGLIPKNAVLIENPGSFSYE